MEQVLIGKKSLFRGRVLTKERFSWVKDPHKLKVLKGKRSSWTNVLIGKDPHGEGFCWGKSPSSFRIPPREGCLGGRVPSVKSLYEFCFLGWWLFLYQDSSPFYLPKKSGRCEDSILGKKSKESNNSKCTLNTYYVPRKPDPLYNTSSTNPYKSPRR